MEETLLQVRNLTTFLCIGKKKYAVVDSLSFDLKKGKTLALVGESGCGKTMAALSLLRILPKPPALDPQGEVLYRGKNLLALSEREMRSIRGKNIGMVFQNPMSALNPVYTIGAQLMEMAEFHLKLYGQEAREIALQALADVKIDNPLLHFESYPHCLSGGMKQRVMIAMALLCNPDILIADEPTTALDVTIQAQVLKLIRELQQRKGMALLLITHDLGVVAEMAEEVIVMYAAQGIERGNIDEIFNQMAHPYTQGLFQSRPTLSAKEKLRPIRGAVPPVTHFPAGCRFHPRCPFVMPKCCDKVPPDFMLSSSHSSKCWLHDGTNESQERREKGEL